MACSIEHVESLILDFCHTVETTVDPRVKQLVEETVASLSLHEKIVMGFYEGALDLTDRIKECERDEALDPDGNFTPEMEKCEKVVAHWIDVLRHKRQVAINAPELSGNHEQAVVEQYQNTIDAVALLHGGLVDLRWAVLKYDADLSPVVGEPVSSADEIIKRLNA